MKNTSDVKLNFPMKKWLIAGFLGWLFGTILVLILSSTLDVLGVENVQFFIAIGIGLGIGTAQWVVLRTFTDINKKWIRVTALGLTLPFLIADLLNYLGILNLKSLLIPVCLAIGSLIVGLYQSKLLKKYQIMKYKWIILSFYSWGLIALAIYSMEFTDLISENVWIGFVINLVLLLSGGIILGITTGRHLKRHLKSVAE